MNEEIRTAAADYRASKEASPEFVAATQAMQLEQAVANYNYYAKLAAEQLGVIKRLTSELAVNKDPNVTLIAQAAEAVSVEIEVTEELNVIGKEL